MKFVSFFAGIGGFDIGLERAGHECVGQVEIDPYALRVLEQHWPNVQKFGDIRHLRSDELPFAELWCGGHPCQRHSSATRGRNVADDLWPEWLRLIGEYRPAWIFIENVPAASVDDDLRLCDYGVWSKILEAADFGAPFKGRRYYAIATSNLHSESDLRFDAEVAIMQSIRSSFRRWPDPPERLRMDDGISYRMDRLRLLGNSVVPQIVEHIAREVWG